MACQLDTLCIEAPDPIRLAGFWASLLGWLPADGTTLQPTDDTGFQLRFLPSGRPKLTQNQLHFDLTSASPTEQDRTVARSLELGGQHIDVGQRPEEGHVVLADPEGNEFCVIEAGNNFLADCGFLGALACNGTYQVGCFWSAALDWPLVWDQGEETAIRSPHGGPKISWGGGPVPIKAARNRLHFDLVADDQAAEIERLCALGATRLESGDDDHGSPGRLMMADPDGNEFCLLQHAGGAEPEF